jgi:hypothetical protein
MSQVEKLQKELQEYKSRSYEKSNEYDKLSEFGWSEQHFRLSQEIYKLDNHCCYLSNLINELKK